MTMTNHVAVKNGEKKIFLAPRSNETSYKNYVSTLQVGRFPSDITPLLTPAEAGVIGAEERVFVWGCQPSLENKWRNLEEGDYVLFYAKGKFISIGEVYLKTFNETLARKLWPVNTETSKPWSCLFFVKNLRDINVPVSQFREMTGYRFDRVQGFMRVSDKYFREILSRYGSTDNFMNSLEVGLTKGEFAELIRVSDPNERITAEDIARVDELLRDHDPELIEKSLQRYVIAAQDEVPQRIERTITTFKRRRGFIERIKTKYNNHCQICGFTFKKATGGYYSEAAHVVALKDGGVGSDSPDNIWVLCANHHKMLDYGAIRAVSRVEYKENGVVKRLLYE
jgi:5-methylcytosine-specific restriction endonuclease McrA